MKIVRKWVAGFNRKDKLVVISHCFRQKSMTPFMQQVFTDYGNQVLSLLGDQMSFDHQQDRLHDTEKEAINTLLSEQGLSIITADETIRVAKARIQEINKFKLTRR